MFPSILLAIVLCFKPANNKQQKPRETFFNVVMFELNGCLESGARFFECVNLKIDYVNFLDGGIT